MYNKILVAVDLEQHAMQLCEKASELAKLHGAELSIVHVVEPVVSDSAFDTLPPLPVDFEDTLIEGARSGLADLGGEFQIDKAHRYLEVGVTKREITRLARDLGADLVVVGSHGRHGVELLLGSTANAVLHHAHCDVLAIRIQSEK